MTVRYECTSRPAQSFLASSRVVAVLDFVSEASRPAGSDDPRHVVTGLPALDRSVRREVWRSPTPLSWGRERDVCWSKGDFGLFASTSADASTAPLDAVARSAWRRLLATCAEHGCPHVVRSWNHVPGINNGEGDSEHYKLFCLGRHSAFASNGYAPTQFSAASAVGHGGSSLVVYLLASANPGQHLENPRQISAYCYPRRYGPRPPSFARATRKKWPSADRLLVSGTASIVGHRSMHAGDIAGQLTVTLDNIQRLLDAAAPTMAGQPHPELLRVYTRLPGALPQIRAAVTGKFGADARATYLRADLCRAELDVEIEGIWTARAGG